jgi:sugar phosphate isomerase/epimerase
VSVHPRVAVSLVSALNWPIAQGIDLVASLGVGALSLTMRHLGEDARAVRDRIAAAGLRTVSIAGGGGSLIDDDQATLGHLAPLVDAGAMLGGEIVFFVSGPTPPRMPTDEAFDRLIACLGAAIAYARAKGVALCIEHNSIPTRASGFVHMLGDAAELSRASGVGIVVELQNCWYERDLPRLFRENAERIRLVQCSDFRAGEEVRLNRRVPGDGDIPLEWMMGALLEGGYAGPFELEMLGPAIEAEGYASAIGRGVDWLSERLAGWGV